MTRFRIVILTITCFAKVMITASLLALRPRKHKIKLKTARGSQPQFPDKTVKWIL